MTNKITKLKCQMTKIGHWEFRILFGFRISGFVILFTSCFLLLTGCKNSPLFSRISANYFPIENIGTKWIYVNQTNDTTLLEVVQKTVIKDRECFLLERNGKAEYWWKSDIQVDKFYNKILNLAGEIDTIADFWIPYLQLPLVENNYWENTYEQIKIIRGDITKVTLTIKGEVISITQGTGYELRIVKIEDVVLIDTSFIDTFIIYEYYSPDTGITKRIVNNQTEELLYYENNR